MVYSGLARMLRSELKSPRRQGSLARWVLLNSASDGFLGGSEVVSVTHECLEALVQHQIGVSFSTRGEVPAAVIELLASHARHVRIFVPVVSMDAKYNAAWEPGAAPAHKRLVGVRRMLEAGLRPRVRLDPMIPFINDHTASVRATFSAIRGVGLSSVIVSYMHLRPGVAAQVEREAPEEQTRLVLGSFPRRDANMSLYHRMALKHIRSSFERVQALAQEYDLHVAACHCGNPGLPSTRCPVSPPELPTPVGQQKQLAFGGDEPEAE